MPDIIKYVFLYLSFLKISFYYYFCSLWLVFSCFLIPSNLLFMPLCKDPAIICSFFSASLLLLLHISFPLLNLAPHHWSLSSFFFLLFHLNTTTKWLPEIKQRFKKSIDFPSLLPLLESSPKTKVIQDHRIVYKIFEIINKKYNKNFFPPRKFKLLNCLNYRIPFHRCISNQKKGEK